MVKDITLQVTRTNTTLSGSSAGSLFTLTGGGGSSGTGGGVQGPLRSNSPGTGGSATVGGTPVTSGNFRDTDGTQKAVTTNTSGPTGTFNQSGNGATGDNNGNCGGDNCRIGGSNGADSYNGNISGGSGGSSSGAGTNGSAGTRGSGGGGGLTQVNSGSTNGVWVEMVK